MFQWFSVYNGRTVCILQSSAAQNSVVEGELIRTTNWCPLSWVNSEQSTNSEFEMSYRSTTLHLCVPPRLQSDMTNACQAKTTTWMKGNTRLQQTNSLTRRYNAFSVALCVMWVSSLGMLCAGTATWPNPIWSNRPSSYRDIMFLGTGAKCKSMMQGNNHRVERTLQEREETKVSDIPTLSGGQQCQRRNIRNHCGLGRR